VRPTREAAHLCAFYDHPWIPHRYSRGASRGGCFAERASSQRWHFWGNGKDPAPSLRKSNDSRWDSYHLFCFFYFIQNVLTFRIFITAHRAASFRIESVLPFSSKRGIVLIFAQTCIELHSLSRDSLKFSENSRLEAHSGRCSVKRSARFDTGTTVGDLRSAFLASGRRELSSIRRVRNYAQRGRRRKGETECNEVAGVRRWPRGRSHSRAPVFRDAPSPLRAGSRTKFGMRMVRASRITRCIVRGSNRTGSSGRLCRSALTDVLQSGR